MSDNAVPKIYGAINAVMRSIAGMGIGKDRENREQRFNFRGIDDALAAFAPLLVNNSIILAPAYANKVVDVRLTKSGGTTYNVSLEGTFTFTHAEDGSSWTVGPFFGEANDTQDKAVSKATSIAERNMFFLTFVVPHEPAIGGDPDGESEPEAPAFDASDWFTAIDDAASVDDLNSLAEQIKEAKIPNAALRNIRTRWSQRLNAIKAAQ